MRCFSFDDHTGNNDVMQKISGVTGAIRFVLFSSPHAEPIIIQENCLINRLRMICIKNVTRCIFFMITDVCSAIDKQKNEGYNYKKRARSSTGRAYGSQP